MSQEPKLSAVARSLARHRGQLEALTSTATTLIVREVCDAGMIVDLASGAGDPALSLAAAFPRAHVLATDRVPELLQEASREARARGLDNVSTLLTDLHKLPLKAASVDAVTSRLGIQFASDISEVLAEVQRVLKPCGVTCHVVWGAAEQPLLQAMLGDQPAFVTGAPGPFQFSVAGSLARALISAGFVDVQEHTHRSDWIWHGDARSFSLFMQETSGDVLGADAEARVAKLKAFEQGQTLVFPVEVHCARAQKPNS